MAMPTTAEPTSAMATPSTAQSAFAQLMAAMGSMATAQRISAMESLTPAQPYQGESSSPATEPEWVTQLLSWSNLSTMLPAMYTAPENMRLPDRDNHIFKPVLVSIGPFHHGKFPSMTEHKTRILSSMLYRHCNKDQEKFMMNHIRLLMDERKLPDHRNKLLMELVDVARTVEEKARGYYSKSFPEIDFVKMMVFDGCFILEIFRMHAGLYMNRGDDPIFMARWMLPALALDIVKLENQIPYFVLQELYEKTKLPKEPTLKDLAGSFLALLCPGLNRLMIEDDRSQDHILSLFHSTFILNKNVHHIPISEEGNSLNSFPSVTDLCLSGIKVVQKKQARNLLEIEYNNGELKIPTLTVDHSTKIMMRNLVAYEQCNKTIPDIFTSYVTFVDALVNSAEDVEVLRVAGVINHFMNNNEEVSVLLNNLTANIKYDMNKGYLAGLNAQIYCAHHSALPQFKVRVRRLVNSREGIVYIATIFAVYLAVLQTVFTVLSYVLPKTP